ncbi:hypothetical protein CAOG_04246 [Capsaspora owczarzaki ATCC 30864]|uniref:RPEL repeat protein n=1 Tax=Capsaspora owczarzaki (strain ATCC 30864) TaxID=595528 RepID=A0A0D2WQV1_CAPO3|nr:hypothetical protein CAOG_04246 [Capsaspora owczarzaki ATCC 30864]KJE93458.1 hypothetical protein CAOG_004246 [Capsaspora owczarzaki ATCC 30864]|eukprot:XP_004348071.1 hypothetical protein CAOG_04246 [Capsaspora owczarzaki ATCC 30864]
MSAAVALSVHSNEAEHADAAIKLQNRLSQRMEPSELLDRNILKSLETAPAIQAAQTELERERLRQTLDSKLAARPEPLEAASLINSTEDAADLHSRDATMASTGITLDQKLASRPDKETLVERNILKDSHLAPALQAAEEELKKQRMEDKLNHMIEHRPPVHDLVEHNIIKDGGLAPALQHAHDDLKKHMLEDKLNHKLENRPEVSDLVQQHIMHDRSVAPSLQSTQDSLKKAIIEDKLTEKLEHRPTQAELKKKHVL